MSNEMRQADLIQACLDVVLGDVCGKKWALLDFPSHANVGDSAIWMGTLRILQKRFGSLPALVSRNKAFPNCVDECVGDRLLVLHGGGNFGDVWDGFWQNRINVLRQFPNSKIVQMPQSIHFENIFGSALLDTQRAIASHRDFTLLVRDRVSLEFSRKNFDCPAYLCPDMAFGLGRLRWANGPTCDILALLRADKEKKAHFDTDMSGEAGIE
ncbi:MAG: polysaccharide pyruvyl transferase family protein, partial [Quisquiliibacterium sp.]